MLQYEHYIWSNYSKDVALQLHVKNVLYILSEGNEAVQMEGIQSESIQA